MNKRMISFLLAILILLSVFPFDVLAATNKSKDYDDHFAREKIDFLVNNGFILGYEDGTVRPLENLKRSEFVTLINRALKLDGLAEINFSDVSEDDWFMEEVSKAVKFGYIKGYEDGSFRPENLITKAEVASILFYLTEDIALKKDRSHEFNDMDSLPSWVKDKAIRVNKLGLYDGYEANSFEADKFITRGESFVSLFNLINLLLEDSQIASNDTKGTSNDFFFFNSSGRDYNEGLSRPESKPERPSIPDKGGSNSDVIEEEPGTDISDPDTDTPKPEPKPEVEIPGDRDIVIDAKLPIDTSISRRDDKIASIENLNDYQSLIVESQDLVINGTINPGYGNINEIHFARESFLEEENESGTGIIKGNEFTINLNDIKIGSNRIEIFFVDDNGNIIEKVIFIERVNDELTIRNNITLVDSDLIEKFYSEAKNVYNSLSNDNRIYIVFPKDSSFIKSFKEIHNDDDGSSLVVFDDSLIFSKEFSGFFSYLELENDIDGYDYELFHERFRDSYVIMALDDSVGMALFDEEDINMVSDSVDIPEESTVILTEDGIDNEELLKEYIENLLAEYDEEIAEYEDSIGYDLDDDSIYSNNEDIMAVTPYGQTSKKELVTENKIRIGTETFKGESSISYGVSKNNKDRLGAECTIGMEISNSLDLEDQVKDRLNKHFDKKYEGDDELGFDSKVSISAKMERRFKIDSTVKYQSKNIKKYEIPESFYLSNDLELESTNKLALALTVSKPIVFDQTEKNAIAKKLLLKDVLDKYEDRNYLAFISLPVSAPNVKVGSGNANHVKNQLQGNALGIMVGFYLDLDGKVKIELFRECNTILDINTSLSLYMEGLDDYTEYAVKCNDKQGKKLKLNGWQKNLSIDPLKWYEEEPVYILAGCKKVVNTNYRDQLGLKGEMGLDANFGVDLGFVTLGHVFLMSSLEIANNLKAEGAYIHEYENRINSIDKNNNQFYGELNATSSLNLYISGYIGVKKLFLFDEIMVGHTLYLIKNKKIGESTKTFGQFSTDIEGRVLNNEYNKKPASNVKLQLFSLDDKSKDPILIEANDKGEFKFRNIFNGKYRLKIYSQEDNLLADKLIEIKQKKDGNLGDIYLNDIFLRVKVNGFDDSNLNSLENAFVKVSESKKYSYSSNDYTDRDGVAIFDDIKYNPRYNKYDIVVICKGYRTANELVTFNDKDNVYEVEVNLEKLSDTNSGYSLMAVLDISGSMSNNDRDYNSRIFIGDLLDAYKTIKHGRMGFVTFNSYAYLKAELTSDLFIVEKALDDYRYGGGTSIHRGIDTAVQQIGDTDGKKMIILISDGQSNRSRALESSRKAAELGIEINTVALGTSVDHDLMREIARITGGVYSSCKDSDELNEVRKVFDHLFSSYRD